MATTKVYHARVNGATYYDKKGVGHSFIGGKLATDDPELQAELDAIIKQGNNPLIFDASKAAAIPAVEEEKRQLAEITEKAGSAAALTPTNTATAGANTAPSTGA